MTIRQSIRTISPPVAVLGGLAILHLCFTSIGEPFKDGDETRHVMTGLFVRDALADWPASTADPRGYAVRYYLQYPALGIVTWPPFFYAVEGLAMWTFGTGYAVSRSTIYLFALLGGAYAYGLFRRTHGTATAMIALSVLGVSPLVFGFTGYVLLEIPTLALVLACAFHFERYLEQLRTRDALLACLLAALAALTRFDGVVLLTFALLRLGFDRRLGLLLRRDVIIGIAGALLLTVPYYVFTWCVYGAGIRHAAIVGTGYKATSWLDPVNFYLYPSYIPEQIGWPATLAATVGLAYGLLRERGRSGVYVALIAATYLTFVPLAEPGSRHAIYWVPALALFAVQGVRSAFGGWNRGGLIACLALVAAVAWASLEPLGSTGWRAQYVCGTGATADYVVGKSAGGRPVLYDGQLNGAFIHAVRRRDPDRRMTVLRADKVLYSVFSDPQGGYEEYARTDGEVLELLHRYDPEFVVVEEPQVFIRTAAGDRLRRVLRENAGEYRHEETIPFRTNGDSFAGAQLLIYRKLKANPDRIPMTEIPVMALGGKLKAE